MTNPMNQYIDQFNTFSDNESLCDLSDHDRVLLFTSYCSLVAAKSKPAQAPASSAPKSNRRHTTSNNPASDKQVGMIKGLVGEDRIEEPNYDTLTKATASRLIDKGLQNQRNGVTLNPVPEPEPVAAAEPRGEFQGSYNLFD